jgi:hypothetical protein
MSETASKDEVAGALIDWHFQIDPGLQEVYRIMSDSEDRPDEPIKLLEVSGTVMETGSVDVFGFAPSDDITFRCLIATITPEEFERVRGGSIPMPRGWSLLTARRFSSENLNHAA